MQTRSSDENSVCMSVRPSVCHTCECTKTVERSVKIFIPYERSFSIVFWEEEWLVGATPSTCFGWTGPRWSKIADFEPYSLVKSASAVTPSKKSLNLGAGPSGVQVQSPWSGDLGVKYLKYRPLLRETLRQLAHVGAKSPILNRYSLVAPQP